MHPSSETSRQTILYIGVAGILLSQLRTTAHWVLFIHHPSFSDIEEIPREVLGIVLESDGDTDPINAFLEKVGGELPFVVVRNDGGDFWPMTRRLSRGAKMIVSNNDGTPFAELIVSLFVTS